MQHMDQNHLEGASEHLDDVSSSDKTIEGFVGRFQSNERSDKLLIFYLKIQKIFFFQIRQYFLRMNLVLFHFLKWSKEYGKNGLLGIHLKNGNVK